MELVIGSCAQIEPSLLQQLGVHVLEFPLFLDGLPYVAPYGIGRAEKDALRTILLAKKQTMSTAGIREADILACYERLAGKPILAFHTGETFSSVIDRGGQTTVTASLKGSSKAAQAQLTLRFQSVIRGPDGGSALPADPSKAFSGAADAARAPLLVYPNNGALLPPNLRRLEVHFQPGSAKNRLFELTFQNKVTDLTVYTACTPPAPGDPSGGYVVAFGTGKFYQTVDATSTTTQALYGVWDSVPVGTTTTPSGVTQTGLTNLVQQTISSAITGTQIITNSDLTTSTVVLNYYSVSRNPIDSSTKRGWYINLPNSGQRVIYPMETLIGPIVAVDTMSPDRSGARDPCVNATAGRAWNYVIDMLTGAGPSTAVFDTNGNGKLDMTDMMVVRCGTLQRVRFTLGRLRDARVIAFSSRRQSDALELADRRAHHHT